jgi:Domain of unknown function (DUF4260)
MTIDATAAQAGDSRAVGMTEGAVRGWLRIEGLAALVAGVILYGMLGGSWLLLIPALLGPDASAVGYLIRPRVGAFTYNLVHNWALALIVLGVGVALDVHVVRLVAAILIAHVGMDRAVGYGLKLPGSFHATHLGWMGRSAA